MEAGADPCPAPGRLDHWRARSDHQGRPLLGRGEESRSSSPPARLPAPTVARASALALVALRLPGGSGSWPSSASLPVARAVRVDDRHRSQCGCQGLERVVELADIVVIGARNIENYSLLKEAGASASRCC